MQEWLIRFSQNHYYIIYAIIIVLACVEGPILSMIFGVLIKLGYFSFFPIYAALMLGDLLGDTGWYYVGRNYGHRFIKRFGTYFSVTEGNVEKVAKIFHKYKYPIMLISKMSNGFGFSLVTLLTAGMVKIPFGKYLSTNLLGQFVWSGMLIGVGYFFSDMYLQVDGWLGKLSIVGLFILLVFMFLGFTKYLKTRVEKI